jgi:hypothetical protein
MDVSAINPFSLDDQPFRRQAGGAGTPFRREAPDDLGSSTSLTARLLMNTVGCSRRAGERQAMNAMNEKKVLLVDDDVVKSGRDAMERYQSRHP